MTDDDTDATPEKQEVSTGELRGPPRETNETRGRTAHAEDPPAYHLITPDLSKDFEDMTAHERRAILLDRIIQAGHPDALGKTQSEIGEEFGVAQQTISDDFQRLSEFMADNVERDHVSIMDTVFRGAIKDLVEDGKKAWAADVGKQWYEWLADMGQIERVADEMDLNVNDVSDETEEYVVITDDDDGDDAGQRGAAQPADEPAGLPGPSPDADS